MRNETVRDDSHWTEANVNTKTSGNFFKSLFICIKTTLRNKHSRINVASPSPSPLLSVNCLNRNKALWLFFKLNFKHNHTVLTYMILMSTGDSLRKTSSTRRRKKQPCNWDHFIALNLLSHTAQKNLSVPIIVLCDYRCFVRRPNLWVSIVSFHY